MNTKAWNDRRIQNHFYDRERHMRSSLYELWLLIHNVVYCTFVSSKSITKTFIKVINYLLFDFLDSFSVNAAQQSVFYDNFCQWFRSVSFHLKFANKLKVIANYLNLETEHDLYHMIRLHWSITYSPESVCR